MFLGIYLLSREGNSRDRTSKSFIDSRFLFYILLCGCQWLCLCPVNKISFIPLLGQRFISLRWNQMLTKRMKLYFIKDLFLLFMADTKLIFYSARPWDERRNKRKKDENINVWFTGRAVHFLYVRRSSPNIYSFHPSFFLSISCAQILGPKERKCNRYMGPRTTRNEKRMT